MYGHRARIGYTSPPMVTEVFPYEFYRVAPPGVTLAFTTMSVLKVSAEEVKESSNISLRAAKEMARTGVDLIVLGGAPVNLTAGVDGIDDLIRSTEEACKVPVTTSMSAQLDALRVLGARRLAIVDLNLGPDAYDHLKHYGYEVLGVKSSGFGLVDVGRIGGDDVKRLAREAAKEYPEADTIVFRCAHWGTLEYIDGLEQELERNVVSASQAIIWHALRKVGVSAPIPGFGRLLRDH